jgi:hypothetical protein
MFAGEEKKHTRKRDTPLMVLPQAKNLAAPSL